MYEQKVTFNMYGDIVSNSKPLSGITLDWQPSTNNNENSKRSENNKSQDKK